MTLTGPSLYPYPSAPQLTSSVPQRSPFPMANRPPLALTNLPTPMTTPAMASPGVTTSRSQWSAPYTPSVFSSPSTPSVFTMPSNFQSMPASPGSYGPFSAPPVAPLKPFNTASPTVPAVGTPDLASAWSSLTDNTQPLTADAMGQKAGTVVASLLKEYPALLEKLNKVDMDALAQDIGSKVEKTQAQIQPIVQKIPQVVLNRATRLLDPGTRELANELIEWSRKEPDPALLAEMAREERLKARQEAAKAQRPSQTVSGNIDPFTNADPFGDVFLDEKPVTWKDKVLNAKDQLWQKAQSSWPLNRKQKPQATSVDDINLEDTLASLRNKPKPALGQDGGLSEADLDALLGGGLTFKANPKK